MKDYVDAIEDIAGLKKGQCVALREQLKKNTRKLEDCSTPHDFVAGSFGIGFVCQKCNGKVFSDPRLSHDYGAKYWYFPA